MNVATVIVSMTRLFPSSIDTIVLMSRQEQIIYLETTATTYKEDLENSKFQLAKWIVMDFDMEHSNKKLIIYI